MPKPSGSELMERIVSLSKRRGFIYPASEIYGGLNGFWDYGPLGAQLKNNLRDAWWRDMVECPPIGPDGHPLSLVGLDSSIIQNPRTWEASGHIGGFSDPMVDCRETKSRFRADHLFVLRAPDHADGPFFAFMQGEPASALKKAGPTLSSLTKIVLDRISKLRAELEVRKESSKPVDLDSPIGRLSRMDAIQQQSMAAAAKQRSKNELDALEAALKRIENNTEICCGFGRARVQVRTIGTL